MVVEVKDTMQVYNPLPTPVQDPEANGFIQRLRTKNTDSKVRLDNIYCFNSGFLDVQRG